MQKIIIIGGGFAGLSAVRGLKSIRKISEIILIDQEKYFNFLPLLPDTLGRRINPSFLRVSLESLSRKIGFRFVNEMVVSVDLENRSVVTGKQVFAYDYLIIASGSETNFYGNEQIKRIAYKLDNAGDAQKIVAALEKEYFDTYIISGGGYTGIEVAANLRLFLEKRKQNKRVIIVERASSMLGPLPEWMKTYVRNNLKKLNIEVFCNTIIDKVDQGELHLSTGESFKRMILIWASGVKTSGFIQSLQVNKNPQGRILVDEYLRINNNCFVAGDAANFSYNNNFLRMAVQFAIMQGEIAGLNVINTFKKKPLKKYKPLDLGFVIPMANNRSCGRVMGLDLKGIIPTMLHFLMCVYRAYGVKNKMGIIKDLVKFG